jgi:hypothetical protein
MNENGREPVEPTLREMVERYREQKQKGHELVKAMFREAVEREREERQQQRALVEQVHREAIEQSRGQPLPPHEPPTIHYTELPDGSPDSPIASEWNLYRREVGRLLAEGHENRWVLIKGEVIIGIWDTEEEARAVALHKYLMQPCLIQQVRSREPIVRMSARFWTWQS